MEIGSKMDFLDDTEEEVTIESTEKMEMSGISRKYDIILDIVKVNTEVEIGD